MSNNINTTSQGQVTPFGFPQDTPAVAGTEQQALERLYLSDIPQDTVAVSESRVTGNTQLALPTQVSIPVLNLPKAAPNAFKDVSDAPLPGSANYDSMVMAFTPPGGNAADGADLYAAFLAEFPKGSPEYEAMMSVINFSLTDPTLGNKVKLFSEAREQVVAASPQKKTYDANLEQLSNLSEADIETAINEGTKLFTLSGNFEGMDVKKAKLTAGSIQESMINAQNLVNSLPASPEKDSMIGFLSKISAAIVLFTNMLYELESSNMDQVNEKTRAQLDESLDKIDEQRKAILKQAKAARKGKQKKSMGIVGKIFQAITVATLLVTASVLSCVPPFGALIAPILFMQATDTIMKMAGQKEGVWGNIGKAIDAVVDKICDAVGAPPALAKAMKIVAKIVVAAVIMAAMIGSLAILYGGGDAIKGALLDTGLIKNPIAKMVIGVVVDLYVMGAQLVFAIGMLAVPGMQGFGAAIITSSAVKMIQAATQLTISAIMVTASVVGAAVSIAQGARQVQVGLVQMRLNKELAKLEEDIALREAMVQLLKKAIKALQDTLNSLVSTLSEVKESGTSLFKKLEYEMGKLHSV